MNEHPLTEDFTRLSDDELDKKYNDLSRRWHLAKRLNMDPYVMHQLDIILTGIESEKFRRIMPAEPIEHVVLETDPLPKEENEKDKWTQ